MLSQSKKFALKSFNFRFRLEFFCTVTTVIMYYCYAINDRDNNKWVKHVIHKILRKREGWEREGVGKRGGGKERE